MHQETVERVCELLYEAAAVSEMWPKALAALADATGAVNAHFVLWSQRENKTQFFASANPDQGWETQYNTYYGAIAPCRGLLDDRVVGDWVASHRYFDQAFVRSSEYFNDFLLRIGGLYSVKGRVFETGSRDVYAIAGVLRSPKAGPLDDAEIARLAASLNGHLRRAAALHHKLAAARPNGRLLESAIDRLPFGIMVVDPQGKVLAANRAAQDMLETGDALRERNGVLQACQREDNERLTHSLAEAVAVRSKRQWNGGCIRISRRSEKPAYTATVAPLSEAVDLASMSGDRAALIVISDSNREGSSGLGKALQQAFGLTPAEARTASLVGSGLAPQEVAGQLGITVGTIRSELKTVFAKLGISRQSELATVVARISLLTPEAQDGPWQTGPLRSISAPAKLENQRH
jgi:DNA-binding CsgD family transcriptional regulator/PAS domain-containing protein